MTIVTPQMWNCHFACFMETTRGSSYLFSEKANCKLEVIVIQLSFSFLWWEAISVLHSVSVFSIAFLFFEFVWRFHRFISQIIISGLWKVCCKSLMEAWLICSHSVWVNNQFAVLEFYWRFSVQWLHCLCHWQFSKQRTKTNLRRCWEKHISRI